MAIIVKVEAVPNAWTWAGAVLVTVGIFLVTLAYSQTKPLLWLREKVHCKAPCAERKVHP